MLFQVNVASPFKNTASSEARYGDNHFLETIPVCFYSNVPILKSTVESGCKGKFGQRYIILYKEVSPLKSVLFLTCIVVYSRVSNKRAG